MCRNGSHRHMYAAAERFSVMWSFDGKPDSLIVIYEQII